MRKVVRVSVRQKVGSRRNESKAFLYAEEISNLAGEGRGESAG